MNTNWSNYIQTTEELYLSRNMRFNEQNKNLWLDAIGAKAGDNILEIGCAGGTFCHKLAQYVPDIKITGIDFDINHIKYAKNKTKELGLDCNFINGDATNLPFDDNSFDLCYSHTVAEHIPHDGFFGEQYRVLKSGGKIVVLSVRTKFNIRNYHFVTTKEEKMLKDKAWKIANSKEVISNVGLYEMNELDYPKELEKYGFENVNANVFTIVEYAPDNSSVSDKMALEQINIMRIQDISTVQKAMNISSDALSKQEYERLIELINKKYDDRIEKYKNGEKLWDFATSTILAVSGIKL